MTIRLSIRTARTARMTVLLGAVGLAACGHTREAHATTDDHARTSAAVADEVHQEREQQTDRQVVESTRDASR
jgi:hypothetical protein